MSTPSARAFEVNRDVILALGPNLMTAEEIFAGLPASDYWTLAFLDTVLAIGVKEGRYAQNQNNLLYFSVRTDMAQVFPQNRRYLHLLSTMTLQLDAVRCNTLSSFASYTEPYVASSVECD